MYPRLILRLVRLNKEDKLLKTQVNVNLVNKHSKNKCRKINIEIFIFYKFSKLNKVKFLNFINKVK